MTGLGHCHVINRFMTVINPTLVIEYYCNYILNNHDSNHEHNVYHTNVNVLLHLYSLSYIYEI